MAGDVQRKSDPESAAIAVVDSWSGVDCHFSSIAVQFSNTPSVASRGLAQYCHPVSKNVVRCRLVCSQPLLPSCFVRDLSIV